MKKRNALLSVYDKDGIVEFAHELIKLGFNIIASGGTAKRLAENGITATDVATLVGGGAILGHRVVTLSREIHAGLLARDIPEDNAELERLKIPRIDLVCVDMYPLEATIARAKNLEEVIDGTDIGGPTMLRSAAKGQRIVICDPADRQQVIDWLKSENPNPDFIEELAAKAEFVVSEYCLLSATFRSKEKYRGFSGEKIATCKYGENAWQTPAEFYSYGIGDPLAIDRFRVIAGSAPSYNNLIDLDRLLQTATHIAVGCLRQAGADTKIAVGVKHGNPCGAAAGEDPEEVLANMMSGDPIAIFGGLILTNFEMNEDLAKIISKTRLDAVISPSITDEAINVLRRKDDKCRFIVNPELVHLSRNLDEGVRIRHVRGGFLTQPNYTFVPNFALDEIKKYGAADESQERDMLLAWAIGSTSNSNTITIVKDGKLLGNGVGQQDRVGAANLAITRARRSGHDLQGAVAYSDSFFPFPDGPQALIDAGVKAIFTSSGSIKDQETIDACKKHDVVLYMVPDALGRGFFGH